MKCGLHCVQDLVACRVDVSNYADSRLLHTTDDRMRASVHLQELAG